MLSVVNRVFNRVPWFFIILFILIFWLFQGKTALAPGDAAANYVTEQTRKLMTMDPAAGARLAALARERDIHALAVSLRTYDSNTGGNGVRAVMADLSRPGGGDLDWYAIGHVGMHPEAFSTADERLQFARSHGQAYRTLLNADATGEAAARYAISLTSAERKGGAAWAVIRDDPSALFARHHLEDDEEAWAYFCREREWLAPILSVLGSEEFDGEWLPSPVLEVTNVARRYDPLVQTVYRELHGGDISTLPNPELGRLVLDMFDRFGELFSACRQLDVPLTETVAIMFANPERFDFSDIPGLRTEQCRENAAKLAHIHRNKPAVWTAALEESNVLWLEEHAPEQAERLMSQYAGNNIASLIFTYYEDMPAHAAEAVAAFGDFGIDMLTRYQDHPEFRQYLRHEKVGVRIIPFMLRFPKDGFAILSDGNYLWIDKYFHADGSVKDQGWI
ncbi:MAG: hypothetical protein FWG74_09565, partial [Planctomycetes bacterium]|nr:hypothetical protein [Planctomycetota bacterium]